MEDTPRGCVTYCNQFTVSEKILSSKPPSKQDFQKGECDFVHSPYHAICFTFIFILFTDGGVQSHLICLLRCKQIHKLTFQDGEIVSRFCVKSRCRGKKPNTRLLCHTGGRGGVNISPNLTKSTVTSYHSQRKKETRSHSATGVHCTAVGTSNATTSSVAADGNYICHVEAQEKLLPIKQVGGWMRCLQARAFCGHIVTSRLCHVYRR